MTHRLLTILLSCVLSGTAFAQAVAPAQRQDILDAVRAPAIERAHQPVRLRVERLNVDHGWAVLVGSLVSKSGGEPDWSRVDGCDAELDRMLWAVLQHTARGWQVRQLDLCASEPPYWELQDQATLDWPCGVYAGLQTADSVMLEDRCRRERSAPPR